MLPLKYWMDIHIMLLHRMGISIATPISASFHSHWTIVWPKPYLLVTWFIFWDKTVTIRIITPRRDWKVSLETNYYFWKYDTISQSLPSTYRNLFEYMCIYIYILFYFIYVIDNTKLKGRLFGILNNFTYFLFGFSHYKYLLKYNTHLIAVEWTNIMIPIGGKYLL